MTLLQSDPATVRFVALSKVLRNYLALQVPDEDLAILTASSEVFRPFAEADSVDRRQLFCRVWWQHPHDSAIDVVQHKLPCLPCCDNNLVVLVPP